MKKLIGIIVTFISTIAILVAPKCADLIMAKINHLTGEQVASIIEARNTGPFMVDTTSAEYRISQLEKFHEND